MSSYGMSRLIDGFRLFPDEEVKVDLGKLGNIRFLKRYMLPGAEKLSPEALGRKIDDGLVEFIRVKIWETKLGEGGIEKFNSAMSEIEEGISENAALRAFEATLWSGGGGDEDEEYEEEESLPLASNTYLSLARRHIRRWANQGSRDGQRLPSIEEGRLFARVQLDLFMRASFRKTDWEIQKFTKIRADRWLRNRNLYELYKHIRDSKRSPLAWDTLRLISKSIAEAREHRPELLLSWNFEVNTGLRPRPDEGSGGEGRPPRMGYKLRDNEIRHAVKSLEDVGLTKTGSCRAVARAFKTPESTIRNICQRPYSTIDELGEDAMKRLEPNFYSLSDEPGSSSSPTDHS